MKLNLIGKLLKPKIIRSFDWDQSFMKKNQNIIVYWKIWGTLKSKKIFWIQSSLMLKAFCRRLRTQRLRRITTFLSNFNIKIVNVRNWKQVSPFWISKLKAKVNQANFRSKNTKIDSFHTNKNWKDTKRWHNNSNNNWRKYPKGPQFRLMNKLYSKMRFIEIGYSSWKSNFILKEIQG